MDRAIEDVGAWLNTGRVSLDIPCQIATWDIVYPALLVDLSYDGACLSLPEMADDCPNKELKHLTLPDVGRLDIIFRWQRENRIGVSFRMEAVSRPLIAEFFDQNGLVPSA